MARKQTFWLCQRSIQFPVHPTTRPGHRGIYNRLGEAQATFESKNLTESQGLSKALPSLHKQQPLQALG